MRIAGRALEQLPMRNGAQDFAARVKELRERARVSQGDLAAAAKLSAATLSRILSGERPLRMDQAVALAQALGVTVIELTGGTSMQDLVAAWVSREDYEEVDRLRAAADQELTLAKHELAASRAENDSLRNMGAKLGARVTQLEAENARLRPEADRASALASTNQQLEARLADAAAALAGEHSRVEQLRAELHRVAALARLNHRAWASARQQVQTLERSLRNAQSEKVGVAVVSAALAGIAGAMLATPAESGD